MFIVHESESIALPLSNNYDSYIARKLLYGFKTLTIVSIIWSSAPLTSVF